MLKRLLSALVLLPVFLLIVIKAPGWMFNTLVVLASAAALWELIRLFFGILLHQTSPLGDDLVLYVVGVTWLGETAAYLVGSTVGRHKLTPVISPRKSVEGALAQLVASIATGAALGAWLLPTCGVGLWLGAGALLGVAGQFGDLAESAIKRSVGTKDTGALIPGHGGVLDRIDSLLFNLPAFYYFSRLAGCA